jgi:1-deoxy-D-xylulose-5-phosphate synthase
MPILSRVQGPQDLKRLSYGELEELSQDCREIIIQTITKTGGHLASNLGVVELTIALHRNFDSPKDWLVWDTSNQCYTHKLVTGRRDQFASIRTPGGLSGFAEPSESCHDTLAAGHAGTGLSYGLGVSMALQAAPQDPYVVVIVGDGALTSGPSYEALNNIVHVKPKRLVVILNDNGWSISENVGWLAHWRNRFEFHPTYQKFVDAGHSFFKRLPHGDKAWELARKLKSAVEGVFFPNLIWDELGFHYVGPVNGHDFKELEEALTRAKDVSKDGTPVVIHALTHKGRGFQQAEQNPSKFHQPGTPTGLGGAGTRFTYSQVFAKTLMTMMEKDPKIVAISAAMLEGTGLIEVKKKFPDRVFDVGIAEEHAIICAGGMAKAGWKPVVSIYSTFLQRSFDQLIHDVALQKLPVTVCIDRAGLVGDDGKTHQGVFDISYTRMIPNMTVAAPKDENELQHVLFTAITSGQPWAVRYPRGMALGVELDPQLKTVATGKGEILREGRDLMFVAYGSMVSVAMAAADELERRGLSVGVANARFAKPLDMEMLGKIAAACPRLLTLEEHLAAGGFGAGVLEACHAANLPTSGLKVHAIDDHFIEHSPQLQQRHNLKLDVEGVVESALALFPDLSRVLTGSGPASDPRKKEKFAETVNW